MRAVRIAVALGATLALSACVGDVVQLTRVGYAKVPCIPSDLERLGLTGVFVVEPAGIVKVARYDASTRLPGEPDLGPGAFLLSRLSNDDVLRARAGLFDPARRAGTDLAIVQLCESGGGLFRKPRHYLFFHEIGVSGRPEFSDSAGFARVERRGDDVALELGFYGEERLRAALPRFPDVRVESRDREDGPAFRVRAEVPDQGLGLLRDGFEWRSAPRWFRAGKRARDCRALVAAAGSGHDWRATGEAGSGVGTPPDCSSW